MDILNRYPIIVLKKLNVKLTDGFISLLKDDNTYSENGEKLTVRNEESLFPPHFENKDVFQSSNDFSLEIPEELVNKAFAENESDETDEMEMKTVLLPILPKESVNTSLKNMVKIKRKRKTVKWYCAKCSQQIRRSHYSVRCNRCRDWLHLRCTNLNSIKKWHGAWSGNCCGVECDDPVSIDFPRPSKVLCLPSAHDKISLMKKQGVSGELVSYSRKYLDEKLGEDVYDEKSLLMAIKCEEKDWTGEDAEFPMNSLYNSGDIESKDKFLAEISKASLLDSTIIHDKKRKRLVPVLEDLFSKTSKSKRHTNSKLCVCMYCVPKVPVKKKPMKWYCARCSYQIKRSQYSVRCNRCNDWLHLKCTSLNSIKKWHGTWSGNCCGVESDNPLFLNFPQSSKMLCLPSAGHNIFRIKKQDVTRELVQHNHKLQKKSSESVYDDKSFLMTIKCEKEDRTGEGVEYSMNNFSSFCSIENKSKEFATQCSNVPHPQSIAVFNKKPTNPVTILESCFPKQSTLNSERHSNSKCCMCIHCDTKIVVKSEPAGSNSKVITSSDLRNGSLSRHSEKHLAARKSLSNGKKHYRCTACPFKHWNQVLMKRHLELIHGLSFSVNCSQRFEYKPGLEKHEERSLVSRQFCTSRFKVKDDLEAHQRDEDDKAKIATFKGNTKKLSNFSRPHILINSNDEPFSCKFCLANFKLKQNLTAHLKLHSHERTSLYTEGTHSNQRPFSCLHCSSRFNLESALQVHVKSHFIERHLPSYNPRNGFLTVPFDKSQR